MKVLLLDVNYNEGSTGRIVYDLRNSLIMTGHDVRVCYGRGKKSNDYGVKKTSCNMETIIDVALTRLTGLVGYYSPFSTNSVISVIKNFKPDVIHIHELHGYWINIEKLVKFISPLKIKVVWTFHCEFQYTGKCGFAMDCTKYLNSCGKCPQLKIYPRSLFFDKTIIMLNKKRRYMSLLPNIQIVVPSKWLSSRVKNTYLGDREITIIRNGVDENIFQYPKRIKNYFLPFNLENIPFVLSVAPNLMDERKGGEFVIELAKRVIDSKLVFVMIGVNNEIENLPSNVVTLSPIRDKEKLAYWYYKAEIFLICSKMENFPTVCIESLSCGTPICGFDSGGTKETAPGNIGRFVEYGDIDGLAHEIRHHKKTAELSNQCISYAKKNYGKQLMFESYLNCYDSKRINGSSC